MRRITFRTCLLTTVVTLTAACTRTFISDLTSGLTATATQSPPTAAPFIFPTSTEASEPTPALIPASISTPVPIFEATLEEVSGTVEVRSGVGSGFTPATTGLTLTVGSELKTGPDSHATVSLTGGGQFQLGSNTRITLTDLLPVVNELHTSLTLDWGQVCAEIDDGALDVVVNPLSVVAKTRPAHLSVIYGGEKEQFSAACLQGSCALGDKSITTGSKLTQVDAAPEPIGGDERGAMEQCTAKIKEPPTDVGAPITVTPTVSPTTSTPILGQHIVRGGETLFCIGRGYGVLPSAIAQANGLAAPYTLSPGQALGIPAVRWYGIPSGPVCARQFRSPYPGLSITTSGLTPTPTTASASTQPPSGSPLAITTSVLCIYNCGSREGNYMLRIQVFAAGGVAPYTFDPGSSFDVTLRHCVEGVDRAGVVTVRSADGQTASEAWHYHDASCPSP